MPKTVVVVVVAFAALVFGYAATRPDALRVERSLRIKAPPEKILALVTDLRGPSAWSPHEKKDPSMRRTFSGAASGKGGVYEWSGNKDIGRGRMEISEVTPP